MQVFPRARASYTIIAIPSGVKPVSVGSSVGDRTPPVAWSLMKSAPARSSSRVAFLTSSGPSTSVSGHSAPAPLVERSRTPDGIVSSPWPPVCESAPTEIFMRGPGISPSAIAILKPCGDPPASRTAVKPESSVRSAFFAA